MMVPVNVLIPLEMREQLDRILRAKKWSLATTVREAIERLILEEAKPANAALRWQDQEPASPQMEACGFKTETARSSMEKAKT